MNVRLYNYGVIDECVAKMKAEISRIIEQTDQLQKEVNSLMGTWSGDSAVEYNTKAGELKARLGESNDNLDRTRAALNQGGIDMKQTDVRGGKNIASQ